MSPFWTTVAEVIAAVIYLLVEHYLGKTKHGSTLGLLLNKSKKVLPKKQKKEIENDERRNEA